MSEMEAAGENLGLLSKIRPPLLEDAGLEDCALPPDSIQEAFLKAAVAVGSRATSFLTDDNDDDRDCISDPWGEKSDSSDALGGIAPLAGIPGPCVTDKSDALMGDTGSAIDVKGARNEEDTVKNDEVVVVGGENAAGGEGEDCVDVLRGLKIKDKAEKREDEEGDGNEKPTLIEGYF